jgi:CheY-like chemotaxis protein
MMRVLVADDDAFIRELVGILVQGSGLDAVEAADGLEAVAQFEKQPFRIALVDMIMPNCDGIETITAIRRRWPNTRIIAMSAGSRFLSRKDALDWAVGLGADMAIEKPFDPVSFSCVMDEQLALAPPRLMA